MIAHRFHPNPFYPGAGTYVIEDTATGRRQHLARWANTTWAEFIADARYHLRKVREPLPGADHPDYAPGRIRLQSSRRRDGDDYAGWE